MIQANRVRIISDLHVWGDDDPLYLKLLNWLVQDVSEGDVIVLAGDIFDMLIGNQRVYRERYRQFFEALRKIQDRAAAIYYIEGNHDFWLKDLFRAQGLRVQICPKEIAIQVGSRKLYVAHGDLVDRSDWGYRILRVFLRSPFLWAFQKFAPGSFVDWVGQTSSRRSRGSRPTMAEMSLMRLEHLRKAYRSFSAAKIHEGFDAVVLGHCHDRDEMEFKVGDRLGRYLNVGFPRTHETSIEWTATQDLPSRIPF
ncbi:MAG: UDP-2,3-diacylglucosamine diphosphatase [Bdellovibrionales bacterium]|nr:UDP-2,3-diacylglucosamine diphosphatase [Bdellovibrionales bacterium]